MKAKLVMIILLLGVTVLFLGGSVVAECVCLSDPVYVCDNPDCDGTLVCNRLRVFITDGRYDGNFGSLSYADEICQQEAEAFQIGGKWVALLSTSTSNIIDRIDVGIPIYNMNEETTTNEK